MLWLMWLLRLLGLLWLLWLYMLLLSQVDLLHHSTTTPTSTTLLWLQDCEGIVGAANTGDEERLETDGAPELD